MIHHLFFCLLILIPTLSFGSEAQQSDSLKADVVIYSATPAGIAAAVSAAKGEKTVLLIEPSDMIGGLVTSGLSNADFRSFESLTGFFLDFANRVQSHYETTYGKDSPQSIAAFRGTHGEPSVNLKIFQQMLNEHSSIRTIKGCQIENVQTSDFVFGRRKISSIECRLTSGEAQTFQGSVFIDASYEGDLLALAGEPYHVGRESRQQYGERMAGNVSGEADGQVQGYNYRLIFTNDPENQREPFRPEGYQHEDFAPVLKHYQSGELTKVFAADRSGIYRAHEPHLPNSKADVNDTPHAPVRLSMPDINDAYPDGDAVIRAKITERHSLYNLGLLYYLQTDPDVPAAIQADALQWRLCRDEFPDTHGIPPKLYIREARRLIGQHVFTEKDTVQLSNDARSVWHRDSIAIGDYVHNCHGTGRNGTRYAGEHSGEFYKPVPPYQIKYGVIVPTKTENLLVPVACSASHFGFGAIRLEPIWCSLGQVAGWAAIQCLEENCSVQKVDVPQLQSVLHRDKSATIYLSDVPPGSPDFAAVQWWGTQGGFHRIEPADQPRAKHITGQYNTAFPGHFAKLDQPLDEKTRARWAGLLTKKNKAADAAKTRNDFIQAAFKR